MRREGNRGGGEEEGEGVTGDMSRERFGLGCRGCKEENWLN